MAGNNAPIFSRQGNIGFAAAVTAAANDYTGIGASNVLIFTADASNGSYLQRVRLKAIGTNVASVARFFVNNGSAVGTATNNSFIGEQSLPATTASSVAATIDVDYPLNFVLPAGYKLYMGLGTAVAAGWTPTVIGGNY